MVSVKILTPPFFETPTYDIDIVEIKTKEENQKSIHRQEIIVKDLNGLVHLMFFEES